MAEKMGRDVTTAWCSKCAALVTVRIFLAHRGGYLVEHRWTCVECGAVVYSYRWDPLAPRFDFAKDRGPKMNERGQLSLF